MSAPQYDYTAPAPSTWGVQLPIFLLALTVAVFLTAQITATQQGGKTMHWQLNNVDKQIEQVTAAQKQADELNQKMAEPLKQASQIQAQFSALLNDVYDLSKDDDDAKKVVQKYKIQRNQNASEGDKKDSKDAKDGK
jgi:septal ring factor EnvC (AmiA/AmiB activator)